MPPGNSGSCTHVDNVVSPLQESHTQRQNNHHIIPHCCFEIEKEVCLVAAYDSAKTESVKEALSGPNARELMDVMKDEKNPMQTK